VGHPRGAWRQAGRHHHHRRAVRLHPRHLHARSRGHDDRHRRPVWSEREAGGAGGVRRGKDGWPRGRRPAGPWPSALQTCPCPHRPLHPPMAG
jgi:hypothetical protein